MNFDDDCEYITVKCVRIYNTDTGAVTRVIELNEWQDPEIIRNSWLVQGCCATIGTTKVKRSEWDDIPF